MNIRYENTLDDLVFFNIFHAENSPTYRRTLRLMQFGFPLLIFIVLLPSFMKSSIMGGIILVSPIVLFWIFLLPRFLRRRVKSVSSRMIQEGQNKGIIGTHEITVTRDQIVERTEFGESRTNWQAIEKIVTTANYIFVYTTAISAHIIPKREFPDESVYEKFLETINDYQKGSLSSSAVR